MKKSIALLIISLVLIFAIGCYRRVDAAELKKAKATAYCLKGKTASGTYTRKGIVASKKEYIGKAMIIWIDDGDGIIKPENYIGTYQVEDSGSEPIANGSVLDIWVSSYDEAINFGVKKVIYQLVDSNG